MRPRRIGDDTWRTPARSCSRATRRPRSETSCIKWVPHPPSLEGHPMRKPLNGVRVLEVAQFTFVPSAGAVLADWGAEVIKIENPVTGDAQRGLVTVAGRSATTPGVSFSPMVEAPNRGKRRGGVSLALRQTRPVFEELVRRSDVFLTNLLPQARAK